MANKKGYDEDTLWSPPPELLPYARYTRYPDRPRELYNTTANAFNNLPKFVMKVETQAQWELLKRLHAAGLLKEPPDAEVFREKPE